MDNRVIDVLFRKQIRLQGYRYSQAGYYFVTICVKDGQNILWDAQSVGANCVRPSFSAIGMIVENEIGILSNVYEHLVVDKYVVMPNHIHLIITVESGDGRSQIAPTVSRAIKQFKGSVTKQVGYSIWQKSYYDHIIRDESDYLTKWNYIDTNPARWVDDEYNKCP